MDKNRFVAFSSMLFVFALLALTSTVTALTENELCESGDLSTTCTVTNDATLDDGDAFNGQDLVLDAGIISSGNYTLNFSGTVTFQSNAYVEGGGDIYADSFENFNNLEIINGTGNAYLCERNGHTTCKASKGNVQLDTEFNITENRFLYRQINDEWNQGYLNWTEDISNSVEFDDNFTELEAYYTASGLLENQEYRVVEDGSTVDTVESDVNFSKVIWNSFNSVESKNVTAADSIFLEASSIIESKGDGNTEYDPRGNEVIINIAPQAQKRVTTILLYSESSQVIDYYIKNISSEERIVDESFSHPGGGWDNDPIDEKVLNSGEEFEIGIQANKVWYESDGGLPITRNDVKWKEGDSDANDEASFTYIINFGVGSVSGYKQSGYLTTRALDAGKKVDWNKSGITETLPVGTDTSYDFGTNESGTWNYYNSIENVPDSRYLRVNASLETTDTSVTPGIDKIEASYNPKGQDGFINLNEVLSDQHNFQILETSGPEIRNQAQSDNLISVDNSNTLSADVKDSSSGIEKVILQTDESGTAENRSEYTKNFDQIFSEQTVDFTWENNNFNSLETIEWKIWARDGAGNWESSETKTFDVDGAPPDISLLDYPNKIDIDNKPAGVSTKITDDETSIASVEIRENSTGLFKRHEMDNNTPITGEYRYDISPSTPSEVDFTIYAEDESGNVETASGTISFQDISLNPSVSESTVNNSESFEVSGEASLLPYDNDVTSDIEFWASAGSNWQLLGTDSPSSGQFSLSTSLSDSGSYEIRTNTSNSDSIYGEASKFVDVLLNIRDASASQKNTGSTHIDVDSSNQDINLSATVDEPSGTDVNSGNAVVKGPEGSKADIDLLQNSGDLWYSGGHLNLATAFGSELGTYTAVFTANADNELGSNVVERTFAVENISVSSSTERENLSVGQSTDLSGNVILEPFETLVDSESLTVSPEGENNFDLNVNNGDFSGQIDFSSPGNKTVGLDVTDSNGITGTNSTEVHVFNLSAEILDATGDDGTVVYRDSATDADISFSDNISASQQNPLSLKDISASYDVPIGWQKASGTNDVGKLAPGEFTSTGHEFDITSTADLGEKTVDLNVESSNEISDSGNFTVEVWTRAEASYVNVLDNEENTVNRNKDNYTVYANVTDNVTGVPLEGVNTTFVIGEQEIYDLSNSTGEVEFDVNLTPLSIGGNNGGLRALRTPESFIDSSTDVSKLTILDIQGVMQKGDEYTIDPVYRTATSGSTSTLISGKILDSTGADLENVDLSADLDGKNLGTDQTDQNGVYSFSYSPETDVEPGKYNATITANKNQFDTLTFNRTVEVRGVLDITNNFDRNTIGRGLSHSASSTVLNDFGTEVSGSVNWRLNDTRVGEGSSTLLDVPKDLERGYYDLETSTNRSAFDDDSDTVGVDVYGQASVDLKPDDFTIRPGNSITLEATVTDDNSSDGINSYPVEFQIDDGNSINVVERVTNSSGVATFEWSPNQGSYDVEASIGDNSSLYYNATDSSDVTEAFIGDKMYLNEFSFQNNPVYRPNILSPDSTRVTVNLTETSDTINRVPVSGETVRFEVNSSETFFCTTGSGGLCNVQYDPSSAVTPGNLDVVASTDRSGWIDVNHTEKLAVRGLMLTSLEEPGSDSNLARGNTVDLRATTDTFSGGLVERNLTWELSETDGTNEKIVANGYDISWTIPEEQSTGPKTLTAIGDGEYFDPDQYSTDVWILGQASPEIQRPDNSSPLGYADPKTVRCSVSSNAGESIEDYPVEFFDNSSGFRENFENKKTVSTPSGTYAEASWRLPDKVTALEAGCRIDTNRTLGYTVEERTSTRIFQTKDDKAPEIDNLSIPRRVSPGDDAEITFNLSDENGIDRIEQTVVDPALGTVENVEIEELGGTGRKIVIPTQEGVQGEYTVNFEAFDTNGNSISRSDSFLSQPGGEFRIDLKNVNAESITQTQNLEKLVNLSLLINNSANNVRLTADSNSDILFNGSQSTEISCGDQGEKEYCNGTFNVEIPAGSEPTGENAIYADFRGVWEKTDGTGDIASLGDFTEIQIERNPILEESTGDKTIDPFAHDADARNISNAGLSEFNLESTGNYPVENYDTGFYSQGMERGWVEFYGDEFTEILDSQNREIDMEIDIPTGTPEGYYTGIVEFRSENTENINRTVTVGVPEDDEYGVQNFDGSPSAVRGSTGSLTTVELNSTGNVNQSMIFAAKNEASEGSPCAKRLNAEPDSFELERQSMRNVSVDYNFTDIPDNVNSCTVDLQFSPSESVDNENTNETATASINILNFTLSGNADRGEALPGDIRSLSFTPEVGGSIKTDDIEYDILVNSTEASIVSSSSDGNGFDVEYTVPQVPDARLHDVEVLARDTSLEVNQRKVFKDAVDVPDVTAPVFGDFDILGVSPGEDLEVEVPVSDNNLAGVSSVSMNVSGPNVSKEIDLTQGSEEWIYTLQNLSEGLYDLNFTAVDPAGLETSTTDRFRVSNGTDFDGNFTNSNGDVVPASLIITDSATGRTLSEDIDDKGSYSFNNLRSGAYNIEASFQNQKISLKDANIANNNLSLRAEKLTGTDLSGLTPTNITNERIMGIGVDTDLSPASSTIQLNYSGEDIPSNYDIEDLQIARCGNYDYDALRCDSTDFELIDIDTLDINKGLKLINVDTEGFSSYTLFAPAEQQETQEEEEEDTSSGGGGGGGGLTEDDLNQINDTVSETQEEVENISGRLNDTEAEGAELGSSTINAELRPGESMQTSLTVSNTLDEEQTFIFELDESIEEYVNVTNSLTLEASESEDVILDIGIPQDELSGSYTGSLSVQSSEINTDIPVNIQVTPPQDKLLDLSVDPVFSTVQPGDTLQLEASFSNQGYARNVDVTADFRVIDPDDNSTVASLEETVAVGTTLNRIFELEIPEDAELKSYAVRGSARYTNLDVARVATASSSFNVDLPFWNRTLLGFTYGNIALGFLIFLLTSSAGIGIYNYRRKKALEKKRYMEKIDMSTIPTGGAKQAYLGQLAEVGTRTFMELDDLTTHALIAGATGSGKTVTGQVMVEEALDKGANVIVLDPTAQWTGYLRENEDPQMTELYDKYGLSESDARAYDGNIRAVEPGEEIDITPYLEQDEDGQIIIFSLHKLDSKNIDEFANKTIQQIFEANLPERNGLETVIVYDEVHRLLEKFGGNGEGLKQLERGAREFRKWGVGMVLLSQVISDFSGEIRANIGTTVQMRTQYDDDLDRIKNKFGLDTVKSIAKAEVGSGMLQSSDYNHGRPYFIDFRPLLHSPHRLSDEELEKYEDYNKRIDRVEARVDEMEENGEEVYEYRSELKLTKRNLKKGSFTLVDTYIDELEEKLDM